MLDRSGIHRWGRVAVLVGLCSGGILAGFDACLVSEHVLDGTDRTTRGGAYNCIDSERLHRCDYIPGGWTPSARGFRCCKEV